MIDEWSQEEYDKKIGMCTHSIREHRNKGKEHGDKTV